jgi:hypothetical protein
MRDGIGIRKSIRWKFQLRLRNTAPRVRHGAKRHQNRQQNDISLSHFNNLFSASDNLQILTSFTG